MYIFFLIVKFCIHVDIYNWQYNLYIQIGNFCLKSIMIIIGIGNKW